MSFKNSHCGRFAGYASPHPGLLRGSGLPVEFGKSAKADPALRETFISMITTDISSESVVKMGLLGCEGYSCKRFTGQALEEKILEVIGA